MPEYIKIDILFLTEHEQRDENQYLKATTGSV